MRKQHIRRTLEQQVRRRTGQAAHPVRFALPFPVCCLRCNRYMDKFTRHNARKETLPGATSCGAEIYRFVVKCTGCHGQCTLLSDPENGCYKAEDTCFKVPEGTESGAASSMPSSTGPAADGHKRYAELQALKRHARRLADADVDYAIRAVSQGKTVQELRREEVLEALKKASPAKEEHATPE